MSPAMLSIAKSSSTRADERALGLEHDVVVGVVGDRAARGERGEPRAAPPAQPAGSTASRWSRAPARPRLVAMPSDSMSTTVSKSARARSAYGPGAPERARRARPRPTPRRRRRRRSAAPGCRAARRAARWRRARRGARRARAPRTRRAGRASAGTGAPWAWRRSAWPERPMRCRPVAIERGEPMRHTRSTAPTSMPSSSDAVATTSLRSPAFRRCSALSRRSRDRLPWCAATVLLAEPLAQVRARRARRGGAC